MEYNNQSQGYTTDCSKWTWSEAELLIRKIILSFDFRLGMIYIIACFINKYLSLGHYYGSRRRKK